MESGERKTGTERGRGVGGQAGRAHFRLRVVGFFLFFRKTGGVIFVFVCFFRETPAAFCFLFMKETCDVS